MAKRPGHQPPLKKQLHPRNLHREAYPFDALSETSPELKAFIGINKYGNEGIDFANPDAVRALNRALLKHFYRIEHWTIPKGYLCPPVPGRSDYLHYAADLLAESNGGRIPKGKRVCLLDVGVGANCIYPLIGHQEYGWRFVGSEVDETAFQSAQQIIRSNEGLDEAIECRHQKTATSFFKEIIKREDLFDLTLCNPPFHASLEAADAGRKRKWKNLGKTQKSAKDKNFGGAAAELYFPGGEKAFIQQMIEESKAFSLHCLWFTTLVAQKNHLPAIYAALEEAKVKLVKTIDMAQGQKSSRIVAWTFLDQERREKWSALRWKAS